MLFLFCRYLQYNLNSSSIRSQDIFFVIQEVSKNPNGRLSAWRAVRKYWAHLVAMYGHSSFALSSIIAAVTEHHATLFDFQEVRLLFLLSFFSNSFCCLFFPNYYYYFFVIFFFQIIFLVIFFFQIHFFIFFSKFFFSSSFFSKFFFSSSFFVT